MGWTGGKGINAEDAESAESAEEENADGSAGVRRRGRNQETTRHLVAYNEGKFQADLITTQSGWINFDWRVRI